MLINGLDIKFGADPEVFIGDPKTASFVSAHPYLPGTKQDPYKVPHGAVQVDGMAAEFNIDPADNYEEFQHNLDSVQNTLKGMIGDHQFLDSASVFFSEGFAKTIPPENILLGCDPDYNAWTMDENISPDGAALMRTAGGHVHIGGFPTDDVDDWGHFQTCARLARLMDRHLGVYSILWDKDDKRRAMYGKAGSFRPKPYGMEYRTLSNKWIFNPKLVKFVYDATVRAVTDMFDADADANEHIRNIIDTSDRNNTMFVGNTLVKDLGYAAN